MLSSSPSHLPYLRYFCSEDVYLLLKAVATTLRKHNYSNPSLPSNLPPFQHQQTQQQQQQQQQLQQEEEIEEDIQVEEDDDPTRYLYANSSVYVSGCFLVHLLSFSPPTVRSSTDLSGSRHVNFAAASTLSNNNNDSRLNKAEPPVKVCFPVGNLHLQHKHTNNLFY